MNPGDPILEKDSRAVCGICGNTLRNCTCSDIDKRLKEEAEHGFVISRWCGRCDKHYARCTCQHPFWIQSDTREALVECNEIQQKMEAAGL